ncbi:MAG: HAMP domain-containing histidine kinase [Bdellovibrio sp.]|nr:HAMP domain-containing histidine kinase [Bdellovibrio sp.]
MLEHLRSSVEAQQKRLTYLKIVYFIGNVMSAIYLCKFNFEYGVSDFNAVLITAWVLLVVLPPLALIKFKSYFWAAVLTFATLVTTMLCLIYAAGGVDAPGIFWLAAAPIGSAILLGVPGAFMGYFTVFTTMAVLWYLKLHSLGPNVIAAYGNYSYEKMFNVMTFLIFTSITTHLYIRGEERYAKSLHEKNLDIENLLRVLLHDIANTLSSMTYQLIRVKEDNSAGTQDLEKIERAVEDISNLLTQVRHLKSVKDGKATFPLKPISLAMVLHEVYESSESIATQKGIKLSLDISRDKMLVNAEKTILGNVVILNLVNNAVKFSNPGERIDIRAYAVEQTVTIEIQDYGIGIPEDILANIFSLNSKTTRMGTQGEQGTGYGMPLVKEYLQMMGGSIDIFSREEPTREHPRGTKITLRLPLAQ